MSGPLPVHQAVAQVLTDQAGHVHRGPLHIQKSSVHPQHQDSVHMLLCWPSLKAYVLLVLCKRLEMSQISRTRKRKTSLGYAAVQPGVCCRRSQRGGGLSLQSQPHKRQGTKLPKKTFLIKHFMHLPRNHPTQSLWFKHYLRPCQPGIMKLSI